MPANSKLVQLTADEAAVHVQALVRGRIERRRLSDHPMPVPPTFTAHGFVNKRLNAHRLRLLAENAQLAAREAQLTARGAQLEAERAQLVHQMQELRGPPPPPPPPLPPPPPSQPDTRPTPCAAVRVAPYGWLPNPASGATPAPEPEIDLGPEGVAIVGGPRTREEKDAGLRKSAVDLTSPTRQLS